MRVLLSRIYIVWLLLAALGMYALRVAAQPQTRLSFCLNLAQAIEIATFADKKRYITNEDELRKQLTSGCAAIRYEFSPKSNGGFRITGELDNQVWAIDEKRELIQLSGDKPGGTPGSGSATAAGPGGADGASNNPLKALANAGTSPEKVLAAQNAANKRMQECFKKENFHSEGCTNLFNELDKKCNQEGVTLARVCLELETEVSAVDLADCIGNTDQWGKCELRRRQLEKRCNNQLRQASAECRGLAKYLASLTPEGAKGGANRTPATTPIRPDMGIAARPPPDAIAKPMEPSLHSVLRLRPVTYESKSGRYREMGFVAEEVELVNSTLVTYDQRGRLEGVKYSQFAALLTSGIQQLYGMCKSDIDMQKDIINRLVITEQENKALKADNAELRKLIFNLQNDIQAIKDKVK